MKILKELRKLNKRTQDQMAKMLGISQQAYATYENDIAKPPLDILNKLADYFEVSVDYLLGRDEEQKKPPAETGGLEEYCQMLDKLGIVNDIEAQKKLLTKIGNLNKEQKDLILQMIDNFKD